VAALDARSYKLLGVFKEKTLLDSSDLQFEGTNDVEILVEHDELVAGRESKVQEHLLRVAKTGDPLEVQLLLLLADGRPRLQRSIQVTFGFKLLHAFSLCLLLQLLLQFAEKKAEERIL
jgi:hypothetical protein